MSGGISSGVRASLVPQEEPHEDSASTPNINHAQVLQVMESEQGVAITNEDLFLKGEPQPLEYRDRAWAVAFMVQAAAVIGTAIALGSFSSDDGDAADDGTTDNGDDDNSASSGGSSGNLLVWLTGTCLGAVGVIGLFLTIMTHYAHRMIQISFFAAPLLFIAVAFLVCFDAQARADGLPVVYATLAAVLGAISTCYYVCFKRYMPFAAANLRAALACLRSHTGLVLVAWGNGLASFGYIVCWFLAVTGVNAYVAAHNPQHPCADDETDWDSHPDDGMCDATPNAGILLGFLLSLFWSHQVFRNVLNVVTAGTVGTWWFTAGEEDENENDYTGSSRSSQVWCGLGNVCDSLYRALTYSFGSICLGSLLVAILQLLESMLRNARQNRRGGALLLCILECIVHLLRRFIEYFNAWAFVYVGLYGYDYVTAGKNVVRLFKSTGWTTFIADRLVSRVMLFCHLSIGVSTGFLSLLMDKMAGSVFSDPNAEDEADDRAASHMMAFFFGFLLGLFLSSTVLFVAESAVRTVIVCFAESPAEFQMNHPELCNEMTRGWSETYPDAWAARRVATNPQSTVPMADARVAHNHDEIESTRLV